VSVILLDDHTELTRQALTIARRFGEPRALAIDAFEPFAPDALAAAIADRDPEAVFAAGTERGNDVLARVASVRRKGSRSSKSSPGCWARRWDARGP